MHHTIKTVIASAAFGVFAFTSSANAADLGSWRGSLKDEPVEYEAPAQSTGGCYVRGDIGYAWSRDPEMFQQPNNFSAEELDNSFIWGVGVGCARANGLRYDAVFTDHRSRDFSGEPDPVDPVAGDIQSYSLMFNLYYDFDMGRGLRPYIGAGIGVSYNDMSDFSCSPYVLGICGGPTVIQDGAKRADFAWALMTGVSYDMGRRTVLDVGYRYIDLGEAISGRADTAFAVNPVLVVDDLVSHEVRVGIRYNIH